MITAEDHYNLGVHYESLAHIAKAAESDALHRVGMSMDYDVVVPTKEEAELLLKPFGVEIVGSEYGWDHSGTVIRLHNGNVVLRSPEGVYNLYSLRTNLRDMRIKSLGFTGEALEWETKNYPRHARVDSKFPHKLLPRF